MTTTTTPNQPAWVESLTNAQEMLTAAASESTPEATDAKTRLAYAWMDIARLLKG